MPCKKLRGQLARMIGNRHTFWALIVLSKLYSNIGSENTGAILFKTANCSQFHKQLLKFDIGEHVR